MPLSAAKNILAQTLLVSPKLHCSILARLSGEKFVGPFLDRLGIAVSAEAAKRKPEVWIPA
jgi:hypothetical protein